MNIVLNWIKKFCIDSVIGCFIVTFTLFGFCFITVLLFLPAILAILTSKNQFMYIYALHVLYVCRELGKIEFDSLDLRKTHE